MSKTKIIFLTDFVVVLLFFAFCGIIIYNDKGGYSVLLFLFLHIFLVIFNILAGIIIFFVKDQELGIAFVFVGVVGALIGGSFCGLRSIVR
jgi:hypothetical protein